MSGPVRYWQENVGGKIVKAKTTCHPFQNRTHWRRLSKWIIKRDIICKICHRAPATVTDHIIPFISPQGIVSWKLFVDETNLQALCQQCHSRKTATSDRGFGHVAKLSTTPVVVPTGKPGRQFSSSSVGGQKLNEALGTDAEIAELLSGFIPQTEPKV